MLALGFFYYFPRTIHITLIGPTTDVIVWVASVLCLSVLAIWSSRGHSRAAVKRGLALIAIVLSIALLIPQHNESLNRLATFALYATTIIEYAFVTRQDGHAERQVLRAPLPQVLIYFLVYFTVIEISSATYYVVRAFDPTTQIGMADASTELQLSYVSYGLLPLLYAGFLFSWAWVPLAQRLLPRTKLKLDSSATSTTSHQSLTTLKSYRNRFAALLDPRLLLASVVAVFLGYYPYFHDPRWLVGTDALWRYYDPLLRMNAKGFSGGFIQALMERHALFLVLLRTGELVFQTTAYDIVRVAPIFLVAGLGFSTWWFLKSKGNANTGLATFTLSVSSVTTTVGLFSSILANWLALVVWVIFFGYVSMKGEKGFGIRDTAVLLVLSFLILFIHPWTWGVFAATVILAAIIALIQERRVGYRVSASLIAIVMVGALLAFLGIVVLGETQGWRVVEALDLYTAALGNPSIFLFWDALNWLVRIWAPFFSPLYLATSILGVFCLAKGKLTSWGGRLILAWLCVSSVASIFVAPIGFNPAQPSEGETQLWRLLFLTPFQLTAPFGVILLSQLPYRLRPQIRDNPGLEGNASLIFGIWLFAIAGAGAISAWMPSSVRLILIIILVPILTGIALRKAGREESRFLSAIILGFFMVVFFNYSTRALSQLLVDPHNYLP